MVFKKIKITDLQMKNDEVNDHKNYHPFKRFIHVLFTFLRTSFYTIILILCIGGYILASYILGIINETTSIDPYAIQDGLVEHSIIVDKEGEILETLYGASGLRTSIEYEQIGQALIDAVVAIEDKTFFEHAGFNYVRLAGSLVQSYQTGESIRGTSTITQQLAKNVYLTNERAVKRKVQEAYYAILLERTLTKSQILEAYLNKINFGMQTNGVASAARLYFSKDAENLNLVESAIIAGIPKAPSRYAPLKRIPKNLVTQEHIVIDDTDQIYSLVFNETAQDRYNVVIKQMFDNDMISQSAYDYAYDMDISKYLKPNVNKTNAISSYFSDLVKSDVIEALVEKENISRSEAEHLLYNRGYIIYSTIDFDMQERLESIYKEPIISDTFDESTLKAIKAFQGLYELNVDGIVGEETLDRLILETSLHKEDFSKSTYSRWMTHPDIIRLHEGLDELGLLKNDHLFPNVVAMFDEDRNIVNDETRKVLLRQYNNVINDDKELIIPKASYYYDAEDNLILLNDYHLSFYQQEDRVQVVVNKLFSYDLGTEEDKYIDKKHFESISGLIIYDGSDVLIDDRFKSKVDGNLIIDRDFFNEYPDFFTEDDKGNLLVGENNYIIDTRGEIQPQSAFVVMDHSNGQIKAIIGGRDSFGRNIYNRALVPHQPGSSIKPIGPYSVAIESQDFTAASVIDDVPVYLNKDTPTERWPINWYEDASFKYRGRNNLRRGIEDSLNVVTAKLANMIGVEPIVEHLKDLGISTIVAEDYNLAATALGGMTYGISPLEMTAAYATYANHGVYNEPISFTKVTDRRGNIIIDNEPNSKRIVSEQVAFVIGDMMKSAVTRGYAKKAQIRPDNEGIPIAGKTGTTSDKRDALFIGYSPYYTGAIWFGNDVRLKMDEGSGIAAEFWQLVMSDIHKGYDDKDFIEPEGLIRAAVDRISGKRPTELSYRDPAGSQVYTEIFLPGTVPFEKDDAHVEVEICLDSMMLATPYCQNTEVQVRRLRLDPYDYELAVADRQHMVPDGCNIPEHQAEVFKAKVKVIDTLTGGIVTFIRDYDLLLNDDTMKFIPKGSTVNTSNYNISLPSGEIVMGHRYNLDYITKPETQAAELLRRAEESND